MRVGWWWLVVVGIGCSGPTEDADTGEGGDADTDADSDADTDVPTTGPGRVTAILDLDGDAGAGETIYLGNCRVCHGVAGEGTLSGPALTDVLPPLSDREIVVTIVEGIPGEMTAFGALENQEIADVFAYVTANFQ